MNWADLDVAKYRPEADAVLSLMRDRPLDIEARAAVRGEAEALVRIARQGGRTYGIESFLQQFSLSTPDDASRDALIAEAVRGGEWGRHLGRSPSLFVNAATWGLMLTGRLVDIDLESAQDLPGLLRWLAGRWESR